MAVALCAGAGGAVLRHFRQGLAALIAIRFPPHTHVDVVHSVWRAKVFVKANRLEKHIQCSTDSALVAILYIQNVVHVSASDFAPDELRICLYS